MISRKKYFEELKNLEFMQLLNKNIGMCSLEELNRVRDFYIKGMQVNNNFASSQKEVKD